MELEELEPSGKSCRHERTLAGALEPEYLCPDQEVSIFLYHVLLAMMCYLATDPKTTESTTMN